MEKGNSLSERSATPLEERKGVRNVKTHDFKPAAKGEWIKKETGGRGGNKGKVSH